MMLNRWCCSCRSLQALALCVLFAHLTVADKCLWILADTGKASGTIGWKLVADSPANTAKIINGGMGVGGYTDKLLKANKGPKFCHHVRIKGSPRPESFSLQLLSADNKPWADPDAIISFTDVRCVNIETFRGQPVQAFKDLTEPVTEKNLPPLTLFDCPADVDENDATMGGLAAGFAPGIVPQPLSACPPPPVLDAAKGLGPDLVAFNGPPLQSLSVIYSCYNTKKPVRYNPRDPWNEKYQLYCEAIEGKISSGCHLLLRFRSGVANIGTTDAYLGDPYSQFLAGSPLWHWGSCHGHWHWTGFASYELVDAKTKKSYLAKKVGFCALDTQAMPASLQLGTYNSTVITNTTYEVIVNGTKTTQTNTTVTVTPRKGTNYQFQRPRFTECGTANKSACQGVSPGKMDVYDETLAGQFFCLTGCDGGNIPFERDYILRVTANPGYKPRRGQPCPFKDSKGLCHNLFELNYDNNVAEYRFKLTKYMVPRQYRRLAVQNRG